MSNLASRLAASKSASSTILAKDRTLSCDTRQTGLNNNALVIGPSGAGKTRNVLKPNLLQMNASYIVLDTKGTLCREVGPVLAAHGYRVQCLNFADLNTVPALAPGIERCGYNPLRHIRRKADGRPNQQDILSVAKAICPIEDNNQPFWDHAAANLLSCLIAYVTEQLPADEQTISSVIKLIEHLQDGATGRLFDDLITTDPQSYALSLWRRYAITQNAERMHASIVGILAEKVMCLGFDGAAQLYRECHQVDFASMGHTPCALFVTVSDIDRNLDPLTGLFITQAFMGLIREADRQPDGSLPVPVRFMLDDFANLQISQIDNVLSIIRSRNIWATLLLQSTNQLDALYGEARARSIMGNCDTHLVLAFQDPESARVFSDRADALPSTLMATRRMLTLGGFGLASPVVNSIQSLAWVRPGISSLKWRSGVAGMAMGAANGRGSRRMPSSFFSSISATRASSTPCTITSMYAVERMRSYSALRLCGVTLTSSPG